MDREEKISYLYGYLKQTELFDKKECTLTKDFDTDKKLYISFGDRRDSYQVNFYEAFNPNLYKSFKWDDLTDEQISMLYILTLKKLIDKFSKMIFEEINDSQKTKPLEIIS